MKPYSDLNISHNFSALRGYLSAPHNRYRPLMVCDTDHCSWTLRTFLLGPYFNIHVLGGAGKRRIFHEVVPDVMPDRQVDPERFLAKIGSVYRLSDSFDRQAWSGLGETLNLASDHGVKIHLADLRPLPRELSKEYEAHKEKVDLFLNSHTVALLNLHKKIMGHPFQWGYHGMVDVAHSILMHDADAKLFRGNDEEIGRFITSQAEGAETATIFGSDHSTGPLKAAINGRYGAQILEVSYWGGLKPMISKLYRGQEVGPVYSVVRDNLVFPSSLEVKRDNIPAFKKVLGEKFEEWTVGLNAGLGQSAAMGRFCALT